MDSLIFDMDGTLWDASDTYLAAWNGGLKLMKIKHQVSKKDLMEVMGWEKQAVLAKFLPFLSHHLREDIYREINVLRKKLIAEVGGKLYPGVKEGIPNLAGRYRMFIVSNCPDGVIELFLNWTNLENYFEGFIAHGKNGRSKGDNIRFIIDHYQLQSSVYIGDTDIDRKESIAAGLPFAFVSYGFGQVSSADFIFNNFEDLTSYFLSKRA